MKVKNARAAELSDFEVLNVLREMDRRQQQASTSALADDEHEAGAARDKEPRSDDYANSNEAALTADERSMQSLPPNLRTIQYEVLETLSNLQRPSAHQSAEQIPQFMDALYAWERGKYVEGFSSSDDQVVYGVIDREKRLTKGERLMLINQAPTSDIELYPLVEEIEDRFTEEQRYQLLALVAHFLPLDMDALRTAQQSASMSASYEQDAADGYGQQLVENGQDDEGEDWQQDEENGIADQDEDMDLLENEGAGEQAVDDDGPDE